MTDPADLVLTNATVHTLEAPDRTAGAVAVRDGRIVRVDSAAEVDFLDGVETRTVDLGGRVLLPGFIDAHTHMEQVGQHRVHADLSGAEGSAECVERLRENARERAADGDGERDADDEKSQGREWILGFGYDESGWEESRYLTREDLDRVSTDRPVAAFRVDMHTASLNGVALSRLEGDLPATDVHTSGGEPTGVLVESALGPVREAIDPDRTETRELLCAAQERAHELGITGVHDMVRRSHAPRVYRDLDREGELALRVRINYWSDHLDALSEVGLATNHGNGLVRAGAIKTFTDGSFGGRTAKLSEPYADAGREDGEDVASEDDGADGTDAPEGREAGSDASGRRTEGDGSGVEAGQWVVPPAELDDLVGRADGAGFQLAAHAIGDEAIDAALSAYEDTPAPADARHRVEHAELLDETAIERFADAGVVASVQPNFLQWAGTDGLYDARLGAERRERTNRFRDLVDAGVPLAFGSDCMPLGPLFGVHHAVNASVEAQRLSVTEALRAYTSGAAYAGFDEHRVGTIEPGKRADLVALDRSPWERPDGIEAIDVALTVVDGEVVHDAR
jgi:predicted amidohydrolase YtcJ